MSRKFKYLLLVTILHLFNVSTCHNVASLPPYWSVRRVSMSGAVLQTLETRNMYQCQRLCWVTSPCVSVTFSTYSRLCSMYTDIPGDSDIILSRTDITSSAVKNVDSDWKSACRENTCGDGTVCMSSKGGRICLKFDFRSCGTPTAIANAEVSFTATTVNSIAVYTCHLGYDFQGSSTQAVCGANELWLGLSGVCLIVSCGAPSGQSNADVTYPALTYNSVATYTCHAGYYFQGSSNEAVCGADGQWTGLSGSCLIVTCNVPSAIANADVTYTGLTYTSSATHTCHVGYNFQGSSKIAVCDADELWSGLSGNCLIVTCSFPTSLSNADVTYPALTYNSIATYTCHVGYNFQGSSKEAVCGSNGYWTGRSGSCQIVTCSVPSGLANADGTYPTLTYNSVATYTCHAGYNFQGVNKEATCGANGQWTGLSGSCQIVTCSAPSGLSGADVTYLALTYSSIATYTCHAGYNFQGSSNTAVCGTDGQWSGSSGSCQLQTPDCSNPSTLPNADVTYLSLTYSSTATYTCHAGFTFQGASNAAVCDASGQWAGLSGSCQAMSCSVPAVLSNADVTYPALTYNSKATYSCHVGYNFQGSSKEAVCGVNGQWSGLSGNCQIVTCGTPSGLSNADVTFPAMTYNSVATYTCHVGYNFQGSSKEAVCDTNGQWTGLNGICQTVSCSIPSGLSDADVTYPALTYNSKATYACHAGYNFQGSNKEAVCGANGQWSGLSGSCQIVTCSVPSSIPNADVTYPALTYNSKATYTCRVGYNFQGSSSEAICGAGGGWTGLSGSCQDITCSVPVGISNADVTYPSLGYNSKATYICHVGYNFKGSSNEAVCDAASQWSGLDGNCQIVTCADPVSITNGQITFTTKTYNSIAVHTCQTGYHFENIGAVFDVKCQADGHWSSLPGTCANIRDCSDIKAANPAAPNGEYTIRPSIGSGNIDVYCDMTTKNHGWTVLQRRMDGSENFHRKWADYKNGFGALDKEFWLGNEAIYRITNQKNYRVRFDLDDFSGGHAVAVYTQFYIDDESSKYRLHTSGYTSSGTAGDSFTYHDGMYFSTTDKDNDKTSSHCANIMPGGWWYNKCLWANLNGQYNVNTYSKGVNWKTWKGYYYSLKATTMMIRP